MVEPHGNKGIEKITPWTPTSELSEALKGSYGRFVCEEYAVAVFGNVLVVQAFKDCSFTPPVNCYQMNKFGGGLLNGTLQAGEGAIGILK
jgi:hypothetical protein